MAPPRQIPFGWTLLWIFLLQNAMVYAAGNLSPRAISFSSQVRPLLNKNCVGCHGGVKRAGEISFIVPESVVAQKPAETKKAIQPGKPEKSELMRRVTSGDPKVRMPPPEHGPALTPSQIDILRQWIAEGATWELHWAWIPPRAPAVPKLKTRQWSRKPLDQFVLAKIEAANLAPEREASRRAWMRRVYFDLIGLPPSLEELRHFESDSSSMAYETVVDRLLTSPGFGERWASVWLDLARYADTTGFERDPARTIWPYRDWVIRALNANLPFDQFTIRQLAGDLLEQATFEDRVATAFHRNTQTNTEGGTDDEEYRIAAVLDRVNTTFEAWQGITFRCIQCHAHPYEPIEHDEYYRAMAYFNNTQDWDLREEFPKLEVPVDPERFARAHQLDARISAVLQEQFAAGEALKSNVTQWRSLIPSKASSTHRTKLLVAPDGEVRTEGTVTHYSTFTVEVPFNEAAENISAIRLEVMPLNPAKARLTPEVGFVVSHFQIAKVQTNGVVEEEKEGKDKSPEDAKGKPKEKPRKLPGQIAVAYAFGDEAEPFHDVQSVLRPDRAGWGAWPRITQPRNLVLVPVEPLALEPGSMLKFVIAHDEGPGDFSALVINRFKMSVTTNAGWTALVNSESFRQRQNELGQLRKERHSTNDVAIPVMAENEPQLRRVTSVFRRGSWLDKVAEVSPGVPPVFAHGSQKKSPTGPTRLDFARWLVSTNNPLTARVMVNRVWEQFFGIGIVETLEDFGSSGEPPTNPELLDFLALQFQDEFAWDLKRLMREIVLSAAYRQDAAAEPKKRELDPRNRLLARGPRTRLSAEMVRDQALKVSGLISGKMYGPPVMPPQPEGILRNPYSNDKWVTSEGEDRHRRAIYTYLRRTAGYPSFLTFDAASREVCSARRLRTNTPLQALVTLNDPVYIEASVELARRMQADGRTALTNQLRFGWETVIGQVPAEADVADLSELHASALNYYHEHPKEAEQLAAGPDLAALTIIANCLLNLDAALNR